MGTRLNQTTYKMFWNLLYAWIISDISDFLPSLVVLFREKVIRIDSGSTSPYVRVVITKYSYVCYFVGSRYKEVNERHGGPWRDRSPERNYREPEREKERERERYPESRERFHEEARSARPKRPPRSSPEGNRNDRRGMLCT